MATLEHVLTAGQSLSVGSQGLPTISTVTENANAKLVNNTTGALTSLQTAAGNQRPDLSMGYRIADSVPGQLFGFSTHGLSGQSIAQLSKGGSSGRFEQALTAVQAAYNARVALGQTDRVRALHWIQGEADQTFGTSAATYLSLFTQMCADYRTDIAAVTGQAPTLPVVMSQTATWAYYGSPALIGLAQLTAARTMPEVYLVGGQYQLPYDDGLHLTAPGYYKLGELHARAHAAVLSGAGWEPFAPVEITVAGLTITVRFHVPVAPLVFDTTTVAAQPHMGFSLDGTTATIVTVTVTAPDTVTITTNQPVYEIGASVGYGITTGTGPGLGNLRDSTATVSGYDGAALPNWALHFSDDLGIDGPTRISMIKAAYYVGPRKQLWPLTPTFT